MGHKLCVLCKFCSLSLWLFPSSRRQWIWRQKAHQRLVAVGSLPSNPGLSWHPLSVAAAAKTDSFLQRPGSDQVLLICANFQVGENIPPPAGFLLVGLTTTDQWAAEKVRGVNTWLVVPAGWWGRWKRYESLARCWDPRVGCPVVRQHPVDYIGHRVKCFYFLFKILNCRCKPMHRFWKECQIRYWSVESMSIISMGHESHDTMVFSDIEVHEVRKMKGFF